VRKIDYYFFYFFIFGNSAFFFVSFGNLGSFLFLFFFVFELLLVFNFVFFAFFSMSPTTTQEPTRILFPPPKNFLLIEVQNKNAEKKFQS